MCANGPEISHTHREWELTEQMVNLGESERAGLIRDRLFKHRAESIIVK